MPRIPRWIVKGLRGYDAGVGKAEWGCFRSGRPPPLLDCIGGGFHEERMSTNNLCGRWFSVWCDQHQQLNGSFDAHRARQLRRLWQGATENLTGAARFLLRKSARRTPRDGQAEAKQNRGQEPLPHFGRLLQDTGSLDITEVTGRRMSPATGAFESQR
jgi:hypothetical protein